MYAARPLCRALGVAPLGAAAAAVLVHKGRRGREGVANWADALHTEDQLGGRFQDIPGSLASQAYQPSVPYPGWDKNWDYRNPDQKAIARHLGHEWPIKDYREVVRKLYTEHSDKHADKVEKIIENNRNNLPGLYTRAYTELAFGGAATRHIILVRHGQYHEQKELARRLEKEDRDKFWLPGGTNAELDESRTLTDLGRRQAEKVGDRLAETLKPLFSTPGQEADVRIHVSTLKRARESADIIASRLPDHVIRMEPSPLLKEGHPAHNIPNVSRGGEPPADLYMKQSGAVHQHGARMEAGFRSLFYRDLPRQKEVWQKHTSGSKRHEYEIVVCHINLIRYFTLRALQLPPEAWLRLNGCNGCYTHLIIHPNGTVILRTFGETGHLAAEEITFGMQ